MIYNQQSIEEMINTQRLKLSVWDKISHYWIVILMLFGTGIFWFQSTKIYLNKGESFFLGRSFNIGLIFLATAILFSLLQYRRLKFIEKIICCTEKQFKQALFDTAKELSWIILTNSRNYCFAFHATRTYLNWGESITVIKTEKGILINSICDPTKTALFSFGWNRRNRNTFINCLELVIRDKQT